MHTLRDMNQPDCSWDGTVSQIGVLLADSGMFQRMYPDGTPEAEDDGDLTKIDRWNGFYGLSLPLLKQGLAVHPVQLDNIRRFTSYLDDYRVLILSYEFFKPEYPDVHNALAQWVQNGGLLIYVGDSSDVFHNIRSWWTECQKTYKDPSQHLFECCGVDTAPAEGIHTVGEGAVCFIKTHPKNFALSKQSADSYRNFVQKVLELKNIPWDKTSRLVLRRGPYVITAVMDESVVKEATPLAGTYCNLFSHNLDIVVDPMLQIGTEGLYLDLNKINKQNPVEILAAAARIDDFKANDTVCTFKATGPAPVTCAIRIYSKVKPVGVTCKCNDHIVPSSFVYDESTSTTLLNFDNSPDSVFVEIQF
ncbi:MAG: hypothetical protein K0R90_143 [Oscillospiraceae bacterium]|jgi:hypothetical protein|nr:hypothetical protein [Oscillospiraceae bacterium]